MIWIWEEILYLNLLNSIFQAIWGESGKYLEEMGHTKDTRIFSRAEIFCKSGMTLRIQDKKKLSENGVKIIKYH